MESVNDLNDIANVREVNAMRQDHPKVFRDRVGPFKVYNDREFRNRYDLSKDCVRFVVGLVQERLESPTGRESDCSPTLQLLIALRYYAKGCYQTKIGDLHGVSQQTVSRIVHAVSEAIAGLLPRFIAFPQQVEAIQIGLYNLAQFPQAVGCIDCTHVPIKSPGREVAQLYINRKGSLNVQIVCDAQRRILHIVARWRGSVHDARIWDNCSLKDEFESSKIKGVLLGDSGYPCKSYLLTLFLRPRTPAEERYNASHVRTRNPNSVGVFRMHT